MNDLGWNMAATFASRYHDMKGQGKPKIGAVALLRFLLFLFHLFRFQNDALLTFALETEPPSGEKNILSQVESGAGIIQMFHVHFYCAPVTCSVTDASNSTTS